MLARKLQLHCPCAKKAINVVIKRADGSRTGTGTESRYHESTKYTKYAKYVKYIKYTKYIKYELRFFYFSKFQKER